MCVETELEEQIVNSVVHVYMSTLSEQAVTIQRLATTGRGILFLIPLNLSNHFVSSVKTDAKEHFRTRS